MLFSFEISKGTVANGLVLFQFLLFLFFIFVHTNFFSCSVVVVVNLCKHFPPPRLQNKGKPLVKSFPKFCC